MQTRGLLAVSEKQALRFFFEHLRDASEGAPEREVLYNASVLAHFATTSTASHEFPRTPRSLVDVFDLHIMDRSLHHDPVILEAAAAQCLVLSGFFGSQQEGRHNLIWYAKLGVGFYESAAKFGRSERAAMMLTMASRFGFWRGIQRSLARELHDRSLLIRGES